MNQTENDLFSLMAHAEDLQRVGKSVLESADRATKRLENESVEAILNAVRTGIDATLADTKNGLLEATTGLVGASNEAKVTSAALRRTGLLQGVFLLAVALVVIGTAHAVGSFLVKSRVDELAELKAQVAAEQATLDDLHSKTWRLELVNYGDGTRGIVLPKGVKVDRSGAVQDGRVGIVIKP